MKVGVFLKNKLKNALTLFVTFFKIGAFTFGGGYAMLPLMQQQVLARAWATEEDLIHFIAVSESTPGPFAINMAGDWGVVVANVPPETFDMFKGYDDRGNQFCELVKSLQ